MKIFDKKITTEHGVIMASTETLFAYGESDKKEKSPNALRTISEASDLLDVPQHVLRFWETKFPQIKPLKRNGGRRFYRPQDLDILQQIKHLLYAQGYTIKGAKKAVDDFIHSRGSVNDNFAAAEPDMLAAIADALNEPETVTEISDEKPVQTATILAPDFQALRVLRSELADIRDSLRLQLPTPSAAV